MSEWIFLFLSEDNAVDDVEHHNIIQTEQNLDEPFDDFDHHSLDILDMSHDMGKPL